MPVETERWRNTPFAKHMAQAVPLQSSDADNRRYLPDEVFETEEAATAAVRHSAACPARAKARRLAPSRGRTAPASAMCKPFPPPETHMKSTFPSAPAARSRVTRSKRCVYVFPSLPDAVAPNPKAEPAAKRKPAPKTPEGTKRAKSAASPQAESRRPCGVRAFRPRGAWAPPPEGGASPRAGLRPTRGLCGAGGSAVGHGTSKSGAMRNDPAAEDWRRRCGALPHTPFRGLFEKKSPENPQKPLGKEQAAFVLFETMFICRRKRRRFSRRRFLYLFYPFPAGKSADRRPPHRFHPDRPSEGWPHSRARHGRVRSHFRVCLNGLPTAPAAAGRVSRRAWRRCGR